MYDLICEAFGPDAVKICLFLLITLLIAAWLVALRRESGMTESWWKYHCRIVGRRTAILGVIGIFFVGHTQQKDEQQQAQQQAVIELFTSITEVVVSLGESAVSNLRTYLTPEEKKSRLLPVGLATNNLAWVSESQCVTSQVREAWQRVPIRRASFRQTLPFPVIVGSNSYQEVFIASSGIIGFDAPRGSELTREIPYEEAADHVYLALLWGRIDFKPRLGSKMWYGLKGDGNFVASYDTVFIDGDTNAVAKVQVEFIPNGDMILRYSDLPACATNAHTVGFQNLDGGWTLSPDNIRSNTAIYLKAFGALDLTVQDSDTDGDGISDYYELYPTNSVSITDPCNIDTDGDGLMDREEIFTFGTNPGAFSSDGSGTGDLWRVSGGFSPSDTPYTNAAPSSSFGILTITTSLENVATNGGAVLRIADQYIPVLPGTTLVSRIAVPRGATNIFILARGVNCDNSVAHITVEASSFTKIRDPSSVFGWSFTLNPSCVTASGTIVMPAYTITPDVLCYHSPTSSTCRITSADPDIYFWTTQGLVREYTPEPPEIPPNSFSNSTLQVSLVSMDMTLSTLASVTNIPVHICNPYSGGTNDYPDAPEYDNWCKLVDGEHVWAPGFNATNCPCVLTYTNAYECLCSRDGQKPCACLHGTYDAKAMPQDGSPTNVLGHAALIIGGTNDLLDVEVPGGSLRPCPLCACGLGFSSSASVYRHTSCIHVTPGALTTNGVFSVAGFRPSTNFADSVFIYKISDCSGSQTVTSYTRKDYTVLGTSVYPTDQGHSVSNWFVRCGMTNALTLRTDVLLPTGNVALTSSGLALLYVYNRLAMTNDLILSLSTNMFSSGVTDWRSTYCDSNGVASASLVALGTVPNAGNIEFGFEATFENTTVSCSSGQAFTPYLIVLEPITTENAPDVFNSSGVASGGTALYTISVEPSSSFPSNAISWSVEAGDISFVNGVNKGRTVRLQGGSMTNDFRLDVSIDGLGLAQVPYIRGRVLEPKTVPVKVWIVRDPITEIAASSPSQVTNMIALANKILSQVAMTLELNSEIGVTNRSDWMDIILTNGVYDSGDALRSVESNTSGMELYMVVSIDNNNVSGANNNEGTILSANATGRTLAHEVCHACGLKDIYVSSTNTSLIVADGITESRMMSDWSGGYYAAGIQQTEIIQKLLMYGIDNQASLNKVDISKGSVYGLGFMWVNTGFPWYTWNKEWFLAPGTVAVDDMLTRQPKHN